MANILPVNPEDLEQITEVGGISLPVAQGGALKTVPVNKLLEEARKQVPWQGVKAFVNSEDPLLQYQNEINISRYGGTFESFAKALAGVKLAFASQQPSILGTGFTFRFLNAQGRMERWQLMKNGWSDNQSDWARIATMDDVNSSITVEDNLASTSTDAALSANMGRELHAEDVHHGTVNFSEIVTENVSVEQQSSTGVGTVVYCVPRQTFLLRVVAGLSTKYYNNFTDRERFCALAGGAPYTGKVYLCGREPYIYHGGALVKMCVTDLYDLTGMLTVQALNDAGYDGQLWVLGVDLDVTGLQGTTKMFRNCANLRTVNLRRVYAVKNFSGWFAGCKSLTSVSIAEMRDAVNLSSMFENTSSLTGEIRLEGLQNCTNLNRVFINCAASAIILPELPAWTTGVATFDFTSKLATLELPNYGMNENTPAITFHRNAPLSKETIVNLLNGVHDRKGKGWSPLQINFSGKQFVGDAEVTAAIANATAKGFTIANLIV